MVVFATIKPPPHDKNDQIRFFGRKAINGPKLEADKRDAWASIASVSYHMHSIFGRLLKYFSGPHYCEFTFSKFRQCCCWNSKLDRLFVEYCELYQDSIVNVVHEVRLWKEIMMDWSGGLMINPGD